MPDYDKMTTEEFDEILREIVEKEADIIGIPGVYEILSEYFNNDVLAVWERKQ
jgi:cobyric acid synthase